MNDREDRPKLPVLARHPLRAGRKTASSRVSSSTQLPINCNPKQIPTKLKDSKRIASLRLSRNCVIARLNTFTNNDNVCKQEVTIRLLKNWGNPSIISCAEIALLDLQHSKLDVISISSPNKEVEDSLYLLTQSILVQSAEKWMVPFNKMYPIELNFVINSETPIENVRFFNTTDQGDTALREAEVLINNKIFWRGEISKDFGTIAHLDEKKYANVPCNVFVSPCMIKRKKLFKDSFGIVPQSIGKTITISLLENYGNQTTIGVSSVTIYDTEDKPIFKKDINVTVTKGFCLSNMLNFVQDNKIFIQDEDDQCLFRYDRDGVKPQIKLEIMTPQLIGAIAIHNCSISDLPTDLNTKVCRIDIDGRSAWVGKLRKGYGTAQEQDLASYKIYLSDINRRIEKTTRADNFCSD